VRPTTSTRRGNDAKQDLERSAQVIANEETGLCRVCQEDPTRTPVAAATTIKPTRSASGLADENAAFGWSCPSKVERDGMACSPDIPIRESRLSIPAGKRAANCTRREWKTAVGRVTFMLVKRAFRLRSTTDSLPFRSSNDRYKTFLDPLTMPFILMGISTGHSRSARTVEAARRRRSSPEAKKAGARTG